MKNYEEILRVCDNIKLIFDVELIYLYSTKLNAKGDKINSFDICVIANVKNRLEAERAIYSSVEPQIPFNALVYNCNEWRDFLKDKNSFAYFISTKGTVIYEKR